MDIVYKYDVAISFAEEDRNAALALALAFELNGIKAYYYPDYKADTLGNLRNSLHRLYRREARFAVALISGHYLDPKKEYVPIEMEAMQIRMNEDPELSYMIPVRLTKPLDINAHALFKDLLILEWEFKPKEVAAVVYQLLGKKRPEGVSGPLTTSQINNIIRLINQGPVHNQQVTINSTVKI